MTRTRRGRTHAAMPDITIRLTDDLAAFVWAEAAADGHPDVEAFVAALVMDRHEARMVGSWGVWAAWRVGSKRTGNWGGRKGAGVGVDGGWNKRELGVDIIRDEVVEYDGDGEMVRVNDWKVDGKVDGETKTLVSRRGADEGVAYAGPEYTYVSPESTRTSTSTLTSTKTL